ncbi:MAG: mechanosensitive ion channel domain-containing protein [Verrucomicrobiota bacterium]
MRILRTSQTSACILLLVIGCYALTYSQTSEATSNSAPDDIPQEQTSEQPLTTTEEIQSKQQQLETEIEALENELGQTAPAGKAYREFLEELILTHRQTIRLLKEQEQALLKKQQLEEESLQLEQQLERQTLQGIVAEPPFDLAKLDALIQEHDSIQKIASALEDAISSATESLLQAENVLEDRQQQQRTEKEVADRTTGDASPQRRLRLAEAYVVQAEETVRVRRLQLKNRRFARDLSPKRISLIEPEISFVQDRLDLSIAAQKRREREVQRTLTQIEIKIQAAEENANRLSIRLTEATQNNLLEDQLNVLRVRKELADEHVRALRSARGRQERIAEIYSNRFQYLTGRANREQMLTWRERAEVQQIETQEQIQVLRAELEQTRTTVETLQSQHSLIKDQVVQKPLKQQIEYLAEKITLIETEISESLALVGTLDRMQVELLKRTGGFHVQDLTTPILSGFEWIWNVEVYAVEDKPIRGKNFLYVFCLIILGLIIAGVISRLVGSIALPRMGIRHGTAYAWQTLIYYVLVIFVGVSSFAILGLSLTSFSVASGALAVGIGFGSQKLINNFISGVILLVERPITRGDVIEIDRTIAKVERIGLRSTKVQTYAGTHVIIPNSLLLETSVTNWTHSEHYVRCELQIGVAYGTEARAVEALILQALREHSHVQSNPEPSVCFTEFGDNALQFTGFFWVEADRRIVTSSDLRFRIDELFRTHGIIMPFPQRDVHLTTSTPLEVRLDTSNTQKPTS